MARVRSSRIHSALWFTGLCIWAIAPVFAIATFSVKSTELSLSPPVDVFVAPQPSDSSTSRGVTLQLSWSEVSNIVAPQWEGVVQSVEAKPGTSISSGDFVLRVSEVDRIAYHSEFPFTRLLGMGDKGRDVAQLHALLSAEGYGELGGTTYTLATKKAVEKLATDLGAPRLGIFDPGWVIYLPSTSVTVAESFVVVGAPAPGAGVVLFETARELVAATLVASTRPDAEFSPVIPGDDNPTDANGTEGSGPATTLPDDSHPVIAAAEDETLKLGPEEFALSETRTDVAATELPRLRSRLSENPAEVLAVLWAKPVQGSWQVPTGAIVTDDQSGTCVLDYNDGSPYPVSVSVLSEARGTAVVLGDLAEDRTLLVAPASDLRQCSLK